MTNEQLLERNFQRDQRWAAQAGGNPKPPTDAETISRAHDQFTHLDALSRLRALSHRESHQLQMVMRQLGMIRAGREDGWTPEQDAKLLSLHAQGFGFMEIGRRMGKSNNACSSRWRRIEGLK